MTWWNEFEAMDKALGWNIIQDIKPYNHITLPITVLIILFLIYKNFFTKKECSEIEKIPKSYLIVEKEKINSDTLHNKLLESLLKKRFSKLPSYQDWIVNLFKSESHFFDDLSIPKDVENKEKYKEAIIQKFITNFSNFFDDQILDFIKEQYNDLRKREKVTYDDAYLYIKMLETLATPNYLDKILNSDDEKKLMKKYLDNAKILFT